MRETPRPRGTAGDAGPGLPQHGPGRAFAHATGASGSGTSHRSDGRSPHTPRGARRTDPAGHPGTTPPVPGWPASPVVRMSVLLGVLALITWQVLADGPLLGPDERIGRALAGRGSAGFTDALSDLGNTQIALPVLACAIVLALVRGARREPLYAALTMAAVPALVVPLKIWTDRQGPLTAATGYYPSGHTATAAVAYGAAALLLVPYAKRSWPMPVAAVLLTAATSIGLVLRGYHWPLDVVGSWCLSGVLLLALRAGLERVSRRSTRRSSSRTPSC
ncbi:phosphatase PAP2 family protein [Streptomyces sp. BE147]|uniref:phosphatase PAP2 family protein n=1 Tax=unclassified Streptomyces TaxID=2593676 RepID=UPI002E765255|nr:phosphatase PAP2 family protein [Streptomyces sp. BE147]MEE1740686.1 phosphatase PAP2 family protein [Streptomyces sp. BE147]